MVFTNNNNNINRIIHYRLKINSGLKIIQVGKIPLHIVTFVRDHSCIGYLGSKCSASWLVDSVISVKRVTCLKSLESSYAHVLFRLFCLVHKPEASYIQVCDPSCRMLNALFSDKLRYYYLLLCIRWFC